MMGYIPEIGRSVPRADAAAKVTGAEKYAADHYGAGLLWAGVRRACRALSPSSRAATFPGPTGRGSSTRTSRFYALTRSATAAMPSPPSIVIFRFAFRPLPAPIEHTVPVLQCFKDSSTLQPFKLTLPFSNLFATGLDLAYPLYWHSEVQALSAFYVKGRQAYQATFPIEQAPTT